ncbi:hypothetical protein MKX07_005823 [Trichoderma sp. CBMAI-0711]|uniref:Ribosomal protein S2 n=1 Tax=Trichoderma parareesei TaxID=858221 RepID=A0A2H2ZSI7_TRIPA|nr:hypothetical protein MKX07_005823 [Trichoderma sp. CBMAI-0711]OTA08598.1 ribosomal protein S2 [Trichoderma parareesei]
MDTAPLLGNRPALIQDHPVFLRASHSPWSLIPQSVLSFIRGSILAYLTVAAILILNYELTNPPLNANPSDPGDSDPNDPGPDPNDPSFSTIAQTVTNWRLFFEFPIISFGLVLWYFVVTFSWTFTHLYYPDADDVDGRVEYAIIRLMSLPRDLGNARYQFYFTLFYFVTVAYSFMNSAIYWFVTRPHDLVHVVLGLFSQGCPDQVKLWDATAVTLAGPFSDIFGEGWLRAFVLINLYAVTPGIMVTEVLFLNSIRRPNGIGGYLFALLVFAALYIGWAFIGHAATDVWPFFFLDTAQVGSTEAVVAYSIGFVLLAPIAFIFMQGFVGVRESLIRPYVIVQDALGA